MGRMTITIAAMIAVLSALEARAGSAPAPGGERDAVAAAENWVALVDGGDYAASWRGAAPSFRRSVSQEAWVEALRPVREPLGGNVSRTLSAKPYRASAPHAPDQELIVVRFTSVFRNRNSIDEIVTLARDADSRWKTTGYWITGHSPDRRNLFMALLLLLVVIVLFVYEWKYQDTASS